jgi:hypothetical protein
MQKFISLGAECIEFQEAARASQGMFALCCNFCLVMCLPVVFLLPFLFLFYFVDALTVANARILPLEAELNASREAWEGATCRGDDPW